MFFSNKKGADKSKQQPAKCRQQPFIMPLEPRIMFDAAAVATVDTALNNDTADNNTPEPAPAQAGHEVAFVDSALQGSAELVAGLAKNIEVIDLKPGQDSLKQISDYLANHTSITALHLFSHGTPGSIRLGDTELAADTLAEHAQQLESWKQSLTVDADILLYGCDIAAGVQGEALLSQLALLTGADIAASVDATGGAGKGGNWVLERSTGSIEAAALSVAGFEGLLAAPVVTDAVTETRTVAEDEPLTITGITIADADNNNQTVTLTSTTGTLTLATTNGLTGLSGDGTGSVTFTGAIAEVNTAINGMSFKGLQDANGAASFAIASYDGSTTTSKTIDVFITAANDAPSLSSKVNLTVNEGGTAAFSLQQLATDQNALDPDIATGQQVLVQQMVQIKSLPTDGTLTYKGGPVEIDTVVPVSELASLIFTHIGTDLAAPKTVNFNVAVSDGGGGVTNGTLSIDINPVNKTPTISGSPSLYEGQSKVVAPGINLGDSADTLANATITISEVVTGSQGSFFVDANSNGVIDGGEAAFTGGALTATQLAQFKFIQNGYEPNTPGAISPSYKISVQDYGGRTDGTGTKLTGEATITLIIQPNNDQPVVQNHLHHDAASALQVDERTTTTITTAMLQVTDRDLNPANPNETWPVANIVYTIETPPTHGQLLLEVSSGEWKSLAAGGRFTQADIDGGKVKYYQSEGLSGTDLILEKFTFTVRDSAFGYALPTPNDLGAIVPGAVREGDVATGAIRTLEFAFNLEPKNGTGGGTAPTYDGMAYDFTSLGSNFNGAGSGWKEGNVGSDGIITTVMLEYKITRTIGATAVILPPAETVYTLTTLPTNGLIQRNTSGAIWQTLDINANFTQADINDNKIRFQHDGNEDFINGFGFTVSDGTAAGSQAHTFIINTAPVNDRPTGSGGTENVREGNDNTVRLGTGVLGMSDVDGTTDTEANATNTTGNVLWNSEGLADSLWFKIVTGPTTNNGSGTVQGKLQYWNNTAWTDISPGVELWLHSSLLTATADGASSGLRYMHNDTEPLAYVGGPNLIFTYQVRDDLAAPTNFYDTNATTPVNSDDDQSHVSAAVSATIGIIPINNAPEVANTPVDADPNITPIGTITGGGVTVGKNDILVDAPEGGIKIISSDYLIAVDSDNTTVQRQFRIIITPTLGVLQLNGNTLGVGSTFTQDDINNNRLTYKHNGEEVGAKVDGFGAQYNDKFHFVVNDGVLQDSGNGADNNVFLITLKPMNDIPTVAAPASLDVLVSGTGTVAVTGISVDDPDLAVIIAGSEENFVRVEVQVLTSGDVAVAGAALTYTAADPAASARSYNNGKGTNTLIIQGTKEQVNIALGTLTVAFTADEDSSTHKIRVTVDDRLYTNGGVLETGGGNPGANGGITATKNTDGTDIDATNNRVSKDITLRASNINDAPTITNATNYSVNEDASVVLNGFALSDVDSFDKNVTVKVELFNDNGRTTPATVGTEGKLVLGAVAGLTSSSGTNTNTITLTGTMANVQTALNLIKFQGATDYNGTGVGNGTLYLKTTFTDFGHADKPTGNVVTVDNTITITPVNDAPVLTVPVNQTMSDGSYIDITTGFTVQDTKDIGQGATDYIEVKLEALDGAAPYGTLTITTVPAGVTVDGSGSTITVKGTNAAVTTALNTLSYTPDSANVDKIVTIKATADDRNPSGTGVGNGKETNGVDGNNTAVKTFTITISGTNDEPVVTVPGAQSVAEDSTNTVISGISYADTDDFSGVQKITVSVTHGTLNFGTKTGLTLVDSTSYNTATVTVEGTKANLNAALATLKYTPTANYHGNDTLTVTADDKGLIGSGGVKIDTKTVAITVTPVNDRPTATTNVTLPAINEDTTSAGVAFSTLSFGYSDAIDNQLAKSGNDTATLNTYVAIVGNAATAAQGTWQVSNGSGGWIDIPTSGLSVTSALVFNVARETRFVPATDFNGTPGSLTVRLADGSKTDIPTSTIATDKKDLNATANGDIDLATGSWNNADRTIGISVTAINDAPTKTGAAPSISAPEDAIDPTGKTVTTLFGGNFSDAKDAVTGGSSANSLAGVAITGLSNDKGIWEYKSGGGWVAVPTDVTVSSTFVLAAGDQLRFRSTTTDYNGTPTDSLTVRLIDNSSGVVTSGGRPDLSDVNSGGITPYSDASNAVTLGAIVTPQNDAPTLTADGKTTGIAVTVTESGAVTGAGNAFEVALLTATAVADLDLTTTAGLDSSIFGAGSITVTLTDKIAGDVLTVSGLPGVASVTNYNAGTGVLVINLTPTATTAQVQTILKAIKYAHQSDDPTNIKSGTPDTERNFTVVLSDGNNVQAGGNAGGPAPLTATVSGTITITPVNDPPVASNDTNSVTENTDSPTSGNVITGKGRDGIVKPGEVDSDPDTPIDQLKVTQIQPPVGGSGGGNIAEGGSVTVTGKYGELTIHPDGSYNYTLDETNSTVNALNNGDTLTDEVFTYTLSDGDRTDSATLTITINGKTDGAPSITAVDGNGAVTTGQVTVKESGLVVDGDNSETTTGAITVQADAGITNVTIHGTEIALSDLKNIPAAGISIDTPAGKILVTGFTPNAIFGSEVYNGTIAYIYTLEQSQTTLGVTESTEALVLKVKDNNNAETTGTLTIQIIDHTPTAVADIAQTSKSTTLTDNVYTNDAIGADGAPAVGGPMTGVKIGSDTTTDATTGVGAEVTGNYGKITLAANGSYTYVVDQENAAVKTLVVANTLTETFTYTITDKDGDTSTTTLTITITANPLPIANNDAATTPEDTPVSGNVLTALGGNPGDVADSDPENEPLTVTKIVVDGDATVHAVPGDGSTKTVNIPGKGTLVINKTGSYTFTPEPDWNGTVPDITYSVTDGSNTVTAKLVITVTPVVDIANDNTTTVVGTPVTTNVLGNDSFEGSTPIVTGTTPPSKGSVTVNANNTITYTPNPGYVGTDTYTYTVTSGGVTETATVTVNVVPANDHPVAVNDSFETAEDTPLNGNVAGNDSPSSDGGNVWSKSSDSANGSVTVGAGGTFTYTPAVGYSGPDSFTYTIRDADGDTSTATVTLNISPAPTPDPTPVPTPTPEPLPTPPTTPVPVPVPVQGGDIAPPPAPTMTVSPPAAEVAETAGFATGNNAFNDPAAPPMQTIIELSAQDIISFTNQSSSGSSGVVSYSEETSTSEYNLYIVKTPSSQLVLVEQDATFNLPTGTFRHSNSGAKVGLEASLADGTPLPAWLSFDGDSGRFTGRPPAGAGGAMDIKVMAKDDRGNVVFTQFLLHVTEQKSNEAQTVKEQPVEKKAIPAENGKAKAVKQPATETEDAPPLVLEGSETDDTDTEKPQQQSIKTEPTKGRLSLAEQFKKQQHRSRNVELNSALQRVASRRG